MLPPVRWARAASLLLCLACGGDGPQGPRQPEPPPLAGSLVILTGDGQTDTAGATFATPVTVEVRDTGGAPLPGVAVWFAEAMIGEDFLNSTSDSTDAAGRVRYDWLPGPRAGVHRLRVAVYALDATGAAHLRAADTITGTVLPASTAHADLSGPHSVLLGESLDLATVVGPVADAYGNTVPVASVAVEAPAPFQVEGTAVRSDVEADEALTIRINGVPFPYRVLARRDLRELTGARGGWVCDSDPGLFYAMPDVYLRRREIQVVVDSVVPIPDVDGWFLHVTGTSHYQLSNGTTFDEAIEFLLGAGGQSPGRWQSSVGPEMVQTGTDPLRYEAAWVHDCAGWLEDPGTTAAHQPLYLTR